MRIVIVGAGILGMMAAWMLARRGHRVVLVDGGRIPNPDGASFDQHRLLHDFESGLGESLALLRKSFAGWSELWRDLRRCFLVPAPVLAVSTVEGDLAERSAAAFSRGGADYQMLDAPELERSCPHLKFSDARFGVIRHAGGLILADQLLEALARRLRDLGVDLVPEATVRSIDSTRPSVTLESGANLSADCIVVTAGAWIHRLAPGLRRRTWAHRQITVFSTPPKHLEAHWRQSPIVVDFGGDQGLWLAPPLCGTELKLAASCHGRPGDPASAADRAIENHEGARVLNYFARHFTDAAAYGISRIKTCFYSMSVERMLVIEPLDAQSRPVWAVCGCNGQGFKFAPLIADLIVGLVEQRDQRGAMISSAGFSVASIPEYDARNYRMPSLRA
jgi:sarcosine oxidase